MKARHCLAKHENGRRRITGTLKLFELLYEIEGETRGFQIIKEDFRELLLLSYAGRSKSLFKPALAVVADEGLLYCTNNVAEVDETTWHDILHRCAIKHGRPIKALDVIRPDADFPSADDRPPLKMVRLRV